MKSEFLQDEKVLGDISRAIDPDLRLVFNDVNEIRPRQCIVVSVDSYSDGSIHPLVTFETKFESKVEPGPLDYTLRQEKTYNQYGCYFPQQTRRPPWVAYDRDSSDSDEHVPRKPTPRFYSQDKFHLNSFLVSNIIPHSVER